MLPEAEWVEEVMHDAPNALQQMEGHENLAALGRTDSSAEVTRRLWLAAGRSRPENVSPSPLRARERHVLLL